MKIYGERLSRTERVLWAADECGLSYDHIPVPVSGEKGDALLAINPDGTIPTVDDDGFIVTQSFAITMYLARKYGGDLASQSNQEEADILRWSFWAACDVESTIIDLIYATGMLPDDVADPERLADDTLALQQPLASLNRALENRDYVVADRFTIGDLNAASIVSWLTVTGFDFEHLENIRNWLDRCAARPKFPNRDFLGQ